MSVISLCLQALLHRFHLLQRLCHPTLSASPCSHRAFQGPPGPLHPSPPTPAPAGNILEETHCPITTVWAFRGRNFYHWQMFSTLAPAQCPPTADTSTRTGSCSFPLKTPSQSTICKLSREWLHISVQPQFYISLSFRHSTLLWKRAQMPWEWHLSLPL